MDENKRLELLAEVDLVLKLIDQEHQRYGQPIWNTIQMHYEKLKLALEGKRDIYLSSIKGSGVFYYDSNGDLNSPLFDAIEKSVNLYDEIIKSPK